MPFAFLGLPAPSHIHFTPSFSFLLSNPSSYPPVPPLLFSVSLRSCPFTIIHSTRRPLNYRLRRLGQPQLKSPPPPPGLQRLHPSHLLNNGQATRLFGIMICIPLRPVSLTLNAPPGTPILIRPSIASPFIHLQHNIVVDQLVSRPHPLLPPPILPPLRFNCIRPTSPKNHG